MTNDADDTPRDLETFLNTLRRRAADFDGCWRGCKSPRCRRIKRCVDARLLCVPQGPVSPMTEEESAEVRASLRQALDARMRGGIAE